MHLSLLTVSAILLGQSTPPAWHSDLDSARLEARRTGKPIFAVLH